jgi:hypothetical protein
MYRLKDRFTTHHGHWYVDPNDKYGITQEMLNKYGHEQAGKGDSTGIFVKLEGGPDTEVHFETVGGHKEDWPIDGSRWAHTTMYNPGSGYNPANTEGPWSVRAKNYPSEIVDGIGLPEGEHVSTFVVLEWREGDDGEDEDPDTGDGPDIPEEPEGLDKYPIPIYFTWNGADYEGYVRRVE